jgi:hypothetical protein
LPKKSLDKGDLNKYSVLNLIFAWVPLIQLYQLINVISAFGGWREGKSQAWAVEKAPP